MGKKIKPSYSEVFNTLRGLNVEFLTEALYQNEKTERVLRCTEASDADFRFAAEMLLDSRKFSLEVNIPNPSIQNMLFAKDLLIYGGFTEQQAEALKQCMEDHAIFYDELLNTKRRLESVLGTPGLSRKELAEKLVTLKEQERNFVEENTTKIQSAAGSKLVPELHNCIKRDPHAKTIYASLRPGLSYMGVCVEKEEVISYASQPRKA